MANMAPQLDEPDESRNARNANGTVYILGSMR